MLQGVKTLILAGYIIPGLRGVRNFIYRQGANLFQS
jgi:hypothetical protein